MGGIQRVNMRLADMGGEDRVGGVGGEGEGRGAPNR